MSIVTPVDGTSWKASVPMEVGGDLAGDHDDGIESIMASARGVTMLVAPVLRGHHGHGRGRPVTWA